MTTDSKLQSEAAVSSSELVSRLRELIKSMRANAADLKSGKGYANPELQSERNASADSMEFWALRIEEELNAGLEPRGNRVGSEPLLGSEFNNGQ